MRNLSLLIFIFSVVCCTKIKAADDLSLTNVKIEQLSLKYENIPLIQAQGLTFLAYVNNIANFDHTGVYVNLKVIDGNNDTVYNENSAVYTILSQTADSIQITVPFNAPVAGNYTLTYLMYQDSLDAIPTNNLIQNTLQVSDTVFQRDNGFYTGFSSFINHYDYFEIGNMFEITEVDVLSSATVFIQSNSEPGAYMFFSIYEFDVANGFAVFLDQSDEYILTSNDIGAFVDFKFDFPVEVYPGQLLILMVGGYGGVNLTIGEAQYAEPLTSFFVDNSYDWYYLTSTPMVRANFDRFSDVSEQNPQQFKIYPNPAKEKITIEFFEVQNKDLRIINALGQQVKTKNISSGDTIDVRDLKAGVYFIVSDEYASKFVVTE